MSPEDEKVYEVYRDLFLHPGWAQLISDLEDFREPIEDIRYSKDLEDLFANRGKVEVLDYIINLPTILDNAYEEADADEDL